MARSNRTLSLHLRVVTVVVAILLLAFASNTFGKPWRGIVPLRSTRNDLTKALGPSPDANEIRANYDLDEEHVYIVFSTMLAHYPECAEKLPTDTVMVIQVRPRANPPLSSYEKDLSGFRIVDASDPPGLGFKGYINDKEGIAYVTYDEDRVDMIYYYSSAEDRPLCPRYVGDPETFIQRRVHFYPTVDEYGVMTFSDEQGRLFNFGVQIQNSKTSKGYIIVYPGGHISKKKAKIRGERALKFLNSKWNFGKDKLELMIGPKQDNFRVRLDMYPLGVAPVM